MATKTKQKKRNTAIFFTLISQMRGYDSRYRDLIKEGVLHDFFTEMYGDGHGRELRLSLLSDGEYDRLIKWLKRDLSRSTTIEALQDKAVRRRLTHQILNTLSRIGVRPVEGDYTPVNRHIIGLPISKGRIIPEFKTEELPNLLNAVRAYCDVMAKRQRKIQILAKLN
jgi:hypothetical protein